MDSMGNRAVAQLSRELEECKKRVEQLELCSLLAANCQVGLFLHQDGKFVHVNELTEQYSGYSREELAGTDFLKFVHPDDREMVAKNALDRLAGRPAPTRYDFRIVNKSGATLWVRIMARITDYQGRPAVAGSLVDVTEIHHRQDELSQSNEELSRSLIEKNEDLEVKARQLTEVNEALHKLNEQMREQKEDLKRRMVGNVEDLVLPYLERLKETPLNTDQKICVNVLSTNLTEIVAPFAQKIGTGRSNLTPREIEVANLVRMGHTSKDISRIMDISKRAVEFHRDSLRRKLGLKKSKKNLRAHLSAI
ncbi:MAG: PAS domain S-box protein [Thermodesulfobacteriota bacterium]